VRVEIDIVQEELAKDYDHDDAQMISPIARSKPKQHTTKPK